MSGKYDVAVVGATGAVGEAMLAILAERKFPVNRVYPLASERSAGKKVAFGDTYLTVEDLGSFDFSRVQIGLFSAGAGISDRYRGRYRLLDRICRQHPAQPLDGRPDDRLQHGYRGRRPRRHGGGG